MADQTRPVQFVHSADSPVPYAAVDLGHMIVVFENSEMAAKLLPWLRTYMLNNVLHEVHTPPQWARVLHLALAKSRRVEIVTVPPQRRDGTT